MNEAHKPVLLLATLLWGCSSAPVTEEGQGIPTDVTILTGGFVRFEDERVPMEAFQLEMRRRVRSAEGDPAQFPLVVIEVEEGVGGVAGQAMVQRLMDGLRASGIRHINLKDT